MIARNCDWFTALFVSVVIARSNCFGFGFSTVIWTQAETTLIVIVAVSFFFPVHDCLVNLHKPSFSQ